MPAPTPLRLSPHATWHDWAKSLWVAAEDSWLARTDQDHFYRREVVLPALTRQVAEAAPPYASLIDIGAGDGYMTDQLLRSMPVPLVPSTRALVDCSSRQLSRAKTLPTLHEAYQIQTDITRPGWATALSFTPSPRLLLSVFVLQELPDLHSALAGFANLLRFGGLACIILVAPTFATSLMRSTHLPKIADGAPHDDWTWVGAYPIPTDSSNTTVYLPHFQRSVPQYRRLFTRASLKLLSVRSLSVPPSPETTRVFRNTVYGARILSAPSSLLLTAVKER